MTEEDVFEVVKNVTLEVLPFVPPTMIDRNGCLKDLGANSVDRAEIVTQALERLQLNVPLVEFGRIGNIDGLIRVLWSYCKTNV